MNSFWQSTFPDIWSHEYKESIEYLAKNWVVQWYPDGTFGPDREISRAEITTIIMKASVEDDSSIVGENCFPSVTDQRYAPFVCYAENNNIVQWYPDGTFKPAQKCTDRRRTSNLSKVIWKDSRRRKLTTSIWTIYFVRSWQ